MKNLLFSIVVLLVMNPVLQAQWSTDPLVNSGIAIAAGDQAIPKVATTVNGITYIAWFSNEAGNYNVRLQKLDLFGNILWEEGGLLVSDNPAMTWLTDWDMTVDLEEGVVLTFQDIRNGDNDVFVYKISSEGEFIWGEDGIELSNGPAFDAAPKICVTASNNTIVAWQADEVVILQKISPGGDKLWGDNGITISGSNTFSWPQLFPVGTDDVILKYFEDSGAIWAPTRHVYARRYDADGNPVWADDAIISNAGGISAWTQVFPFINDGDDGFFIAWHDDRDNDMHSSTFVQHVSADGEVLLGDNGTEASTQFNRHHFYPQLALPQGSEDIFVYWNEMDTDQNNRGIYGQKINASGEREWTDNGKVFIEISSTNVYPFAASQSDDDMVVFFEKYTSAIDAGISAMRIDADGNFVWTQQMVELCAVQSQKIHPVAGHFAFGQWIAAWEDTRNGNADIYAQNVQLNGDLGPVTVGEVEIHPDTLHFEENPKTLQFHIVNNTQDPYTITYIDEDGMFFWVNPYPTLPYTIPSGDSLTVDVYFEFISAEQISGYVYETLHIVSPPDTHKVVIAINEDLLIGVQTQVRQLIGVYPNPSRSFFTFAFDETPGVNDQLVIRDQSGKIVRQWPVHGKDKIIWDGRRENNALLPAGLYIYQLQSLKGHITGKITLFR